MDYFLGQIELFPYGFVPMGWLLCNGQILQIQQYSALFSLIGNKFGGNGIRDLLRLGEGESVTAMTAWNPARSNSRYVCLVTRTGQVKRFEASLLAGELRQAPYFQLEKKYKSFPAGLGAGDENDHLMLGTNLGRAQKTTRATMHAVPTRYLRSRSISRCSTKPAGSP